MAVNCRDIFQTQVPNSSHSPIASAEERVGNQLLVTQIPMMPDHQAVSQGWQKKPKMQNIQAAGPGVKASLYSGKSDGHLLNGEEKAFLA